MSDAGSKNIVVVGAGFAGLRAALDLEVRLRERKDYRIVVIDRRAHHLYTPLLYEVATGYFEKETAECEGLLKAGACMLLERFPTIIAGHRIEFIPCDAVRVDHAKREVLCSDGSRTPYEHLVLAAGSVADFPPIDGLREHAVAMKTIDDALAIRRAVRDYVDRRRAGTEERVTVMVCGAGATGVELAGELTRFMLQEVRRKHLVFGDFSITLVEATGRVLGGFSPTVSRWALDRLRRLGVKVMLDTCVKRVGRGEVVLAPRPLKEGEADSGLLCEFAPEKEKRYEADIIVWAGGVRAPKFLEESGFGVDRKGRVPVDATLRVKGEYTNIWALGDCAALEDPGTGQPLPGLARHAFSQGKLVARNVAAATQGTTFETFRIPPGGAVIPIGGKWAIVSLGPIMFYGWLGYLARKIADLNYFLSILPFRQALVFWWRGARVYIKND